MTEQEPSIAIIGLGYVGLPLAVAFGSIREVVGFDINANRIAELQAGRDSTREVDAETLRAARHLTFSSEPESIRAAGVYIVTTPTPVDSAHQPDLSPVLAATATIGQFLAPGDIVVYESTVYPGATEEVCVPALETASGLVFNEDFYVGYSPERINPGDKEHRLSTITKVTSGSTHEVADRVDALYASIVEAGTHRASSIRVAEAAKVIENTQRDVNIALMNELAMLFDRLGIDTLEVLEAAGSKWNFLPFRPGLVGGHCIGVDPYYLTHKAQSVGHHPEIILAGRRINDGMGAYAATRLVKAMLRSGMTVRGSKILVLGVTFKENTPDLRNSRVVDVIDELVSFGADVDVHDPWVSAVDMQRELGLSAVESPAHGAYDAVLLAVPHQDFVGAGSIAIRAYGKKGSSLLFDLKSVFPAQESDLRL